MRYVKCFILLWLALACLPSGAQSYTENNFKNYLYLQTNYHLEKRGTKTYSYGYPDFALSYERRLLNFGRNNLLAGFRTGAYMEYVLTGDGWSHPTYTRFFFGFTPSYRVDVSKRVKFQFNFLWDVLLPHNYDETWSYFAIEPSFNFYFTKNLYAAISATKGSFVWFDPRADMDKAGLKIGWAF